MIRSEMLERMKAEEYMEWMALDYEEPGTGTPVSQPKRQQSPEEMFAVLKAYSPKPKAQHGRSHR